MRLLEEGGAVRRHPIRAYGVGLLAFVLALLLRWKIEGVLPPGFPYLTFFPAVILTAFVAGTGPGILCALLSGISAWILFIPPVGLADVSPGKLLAITFFVVIVAVDIALLHLMRIAADRLRAERERTAQLYDAQRILFQELQHRVANNMAFVGSLLHLQRRKVLADPSGAATALDDAMQRIDTMSRVHRRLYDPLSVELPIDSYFSELCDDLVKASGVTGITCRIDMPDIRMNITRLMTLSLLVTELVTNSLKHAFVGRAAGRITLSLAAEEGDMLTLTVSDDGVGLPIGFEPAQSRGLGTRISQSLAGQLGGTLETRSDKGTTTQIRFRP